MKFGQIALRALLLGSLLGGPDLAHAQAGNLLRIVPSCGATQYYNAAQAGQYGAGTVDYFGNTCTPNGVGTTNAPGTSGSQAQSVQGVNGGVPQAVLVSPGTTNPSSTTAEGSRQIKASSGGLCGLNVVSGATAGYIMLFDATSVPADGAVQPKWAFPIAANTGYSGSPSGSDACMSFSTGILAVFSSTGPFTKTISATAFFHGEAR